MKRRPTALERLLMAATLALATGRPAEALTRIGGTPNSGVPAVRVYDATAPASPVLIDRTDDLPFAGPHAFVHDALFVASGSELRVYDRRDLRAPRAVWGAGAPVLGVADGPERGLVLVQDPTSLRLVRFRDDTTVEIVWSFAVSSTGLAGPTGRLVVRDGGLAYVADASLPGVRVVAVDPGAPPTTVAAYTSSDGPVHDLALWNTRLTMLTATSVVVADIANRQAPAITRLGAFPTPVRAASADVNSRRAFVAAGTMLLVLDVDPDSLGFLGAIVDHYDAADVIRAVKLDRGNRAYLVLPDRLEILDVSPHGGR